MAPHDWTSPHNEVLWQDEVKTLFDPCPPGWRVPPSGDEESGLSPWAAFSMNNSVWNDSEEKTLKGRMFDLTAVHGPTMAWYPASGFREVAAKLSLCGTYTHNWPSTFGFQIHTTSAMVYPAYAYIGPARSYSVRCLRE